MKIKTAVLGLLLSTAAFAQQGPVKFERTYKVGESDAYGMKMSVSMAAMGEVQIHFKSTQKVVKVYEDGAADIETTTTDMKVMMGGNELPTPEAPAQVTKQKYDKFGNPLGKPEGSKGMGEEMNFTRFGSAFGQAGLEVGKEIPIDVKNEKTKKQEVLGTAKLESVKDNLATIISSLKVFSAESDKPMNIAMTTLLDTLTSKVNSIKGTVTGLPSQQGMEIDKVDFEMTRIITK